MIEPLAHPVFDPVHLEWAGKRYTIAPNRVMGAIAAIEQHVTLGELLDLAKARGSVPLGTIAIAYASVLQYAGATVEAAEVYAGMFAGKASTELISAAVHGLAGMMLPPARGRPDGGGEAPAPGNQNRRARRAAASSSRTRTKLRS